LQQEIAPQFLQLLMGAMATLNIGDPVRLDVDLGPVIDLAAQQLLTDYLQARGQQGCRIYQSAQEKPHQEGYFVTPALVWLESVAQLEKEIFGPILHILVYRSAEVGVLVHAINNNGYGLTLGIQTRIEAFAQRISKEVRAGNVYINRNMIGAAVGTQPFGGMGMSGTGPKAGGPHYLVRLCNERVITVNRAAQGGDAELLASMQE